LVRQPGEVVEAGLLLQGVHAGGRIASFLRHALIPAILLRLTWFDVLDGNA